MGCPIRISTDQSLLAAPHGFSQRATSFIASWCQGIHRMPLSRSVIPRFNPGAPCTETILSERSSMIGDQSSKQLPRTSEAPPSRIAPDFILHFAHNRFFASHHTDKIPSRASEPSLPHRWNPPQRTNVGQTGGKTTGHLHGLTPTKTPHAPRDAPEPDLP